MLQTVKKKLVSAASLPRPPPSFFPSGPRLRRMRPSLVTRRDVRTGRERGCATCSSRSSGPSPPKLPSRALLSSSLGVSVAVQVLTADGSTHLYRRLSVWDPTRVESPPGITLTRPPPHPTPSPQGTADPKGEMATPKVGGSPTGNGTPTSGGTDASADWASYEDLPMFKGNIHAHTHPRAHTHARPAEHSPLAPSLQSFHPHPHPIRPIPSRVCPA